jgi:hypothetical protein
MSLEIEVSEMKLSATDAERYATCKQVLRDGMAICYIVGSAAREIKEKQWYLADGHKTFDAFCDAEFGWTKRYMNQLIVDANAINSLPVSMRKLVMSHGAAKELAKIPEILRPAVVQAATDGGKKPASATAIKKAGPPPRPTPKPGTVSSRPGKSSPPPRKTSPASHGKVEPKKFKDETGLEVPIEILESWKKAAEVSQELLTYISAIRMQIANAETDHNPIFVELDFMDDKAKLDQVYVDVKCSKPYAICPTCQGKLPAGCLMCKERGFVSQFYWEHKVSLEARKMRQG